MDTDFRGFGLDELANFRLDMIVAVTLEQQRIQGQLHGMGLIGYQ